MIQAPRAAARMAFTGCLAALGTLVLALSGCGGDTPAKAGDTPIAASTQARATTPAAAPASDRCGRQIGDFVDALTDLRENLVSGLSYEQYVEAIDALHARYDEIPTRELTLECLAKAGTPGEQAFGRYLEAANAWGECIDEDGCDAPTVEPALQKQWRAASRLLDEVQRGLGS